jgi:hypothetical protein
MYGLQQDFCIDRCGICAQYVGKCNEWVIAPRDDALAQTVSDPHIQERLSRKEASHPDPRWFPLSVEASRLQFFDRLD